MLFKDINHFFGRLLRRASTPLRPGELDRATLGHPGKFGYRIAEDEEGSDWTPLAAVPLPAFPRSRSWRPGRPGKS